MWHQSAREKVLGKCLVCGAAEWDVVVKREDDDDPPLNYGYWNSKGVCVLSIAEASLSRWEERDEEKLKSAPVWEDYDSRCLPIPTRLQGEHVLHTPDNLKSKKSGDKKKRMSGKEMVASPMMSFATGDSSYRTDATLVLYLANDFHWRGAKFVTVSGAGLAILKFQVQGKGSAAKSLRFRKCNRIQEQGGCHGSNGGLLKKGVRVALRLQEGDANDEAVSSEVKDKSESPTQAVV